MARVVHCGDISNNISNIFREVWVSLSLDLKNVSLATEVRESRIHQYGIFHLYVANGKNNFDGFHGDSLAKLPKKCKDIFTKNDFKVLTSEWKASNIDYFKMRMVVID